MKGVHLRSLAGLLCFLSILIGCQTEEERYRNEILAVFHQYKIALHSPDAAEKMYPLLSGMYLTDFKINIDFALHAREKKMRFLQFQQKAMVLSMRHKVPIDVLASSDAQKVLKSLFQDVISFIPEDTPLTNLQFISDKSAIGMYHTALYSKSIMFYKHQKTGHWLIDPRGDYRILKEDIQNLIEENKAKGITEEDMLKTIVFGLSASPDSVLKWDPLVPKLN